VYVCHTHLYTPYLLITIAEVSILTFQVTLVLHLGVQYQIIINM